MNPEKYFDWFATVEKSVETIAEANAVLDKAISGFNQR